MNHWLITRYRPGAFLSDQRGTCRKCGEQVYFAHAENPYPERNMRGIWLHIGQTPDDDFEYNDPTYHPADPKEFCAESVTVDGYDRCGRPVKYEDIHAENYACGFHMKSWLEYEANRKRQAEQRAQQVQRDLRMAFEREQYAQAAVWINEHGFGHLIGKYTTKERYRNGFDRNAEVDVFVLKEFLEGIVERLASNATDG